MVPRELLPNLPSLHTYTLPHTIAAIPLSYARDGRPELGTMCQLPEGTELEICGDGFNDRTVKVRWEGQSYFVFVDDVAVNESPVEDAPSYPLKAASRKPNERVRVRSLSTARAAS